MDVRHDDRKARQAERFVPHSTPPPAWLPDDPPSPGVSCLQATEGEDGVDRTERLDGAESGRLPSPPIPPPPPPPSCIDSK